MNKVNDLLLYKNPENTDVFETMLKITYDEADSDEVKTLTNECVSHILKISEKMGFNGNLWQDYLAYNLANDENAFSLSCERKGRTEGSINLAALNDMKIFRKMFDVDLYAYDEEHGTCLSLLTDFTNNNENDRYYNKRIRNRIIALADELAAAYDVNTFLDVLCNFYKDSGVGVIGLF